MIDKIGDSYPEHGREGSSMYSPAYIKAAGDNARYAIGMLQNAADNLKQAGIPASEPVIDLLWQVADQVRHAESKIASIHKSVREAKALKAD